MAGPSQFHFYEDSFSSLNNSLTSFWGDVASNVIGSITHTAYILLTIYVALWGWSMLRGMIHEPVMDGATRMVRLSVITALALNLGLYSSYVADFLWNTPDALAGIVASGYSNSSGNVQYLDSLMGKIYDLGDAFWAKANSAGGMVPDLGMLAVAILIWAAGVAATAYGAFLLALSKMALAIILGIGPIFILLTMFESTKRYFEAWLGQALNYVFLVVLSAASIKLIMTIIDKYLSISGTAALAAPSIDLALPVIVLCIIASLVMVQLPSVASALGGGAAISTLGAVGYAYGKAKGGVAAARPTNVRREYRKLASDARIVRSAASAPAAVYRRITGGTRNRTNKS